MDTIIYLVLAVAIILFQVYSEKKKKELKNAQQYSEENDLHEEAEPEHDMFDWDETDINQPEVEKRKVVAPAAVDINHPISADAYDVDNSGAIYESTEISDFENKEGRKVETSPLSAGFDPKLFIIYSQIAEPKFRD